MNAADGQRSAPHVKIHHKIRAVKHRLREPSLTLLLCVQLFMIFGLAPVLSLGIDIPSDVLLVTFLSFILFVVVSSRGIGPTIVIVAALLLSAAAAIIRQLHQTAITDWLGAGGGVLSAATLSWVVAKAVFGPGRMNEHRVRGAVLLYLNIAILFATLFRLVAERVPGSFAGLPADFSATRSVGDLMYFSMTTLTTVGYGDIVPINPIARSLANFEALMGQLYPAIILGRIVTLYTPKERDGK